jgi:hypothetical protein
MDRRTTIAEGLLSCKPFVARYYKGFDDTNHTSQAPGLPNHLAWSLGHCALIMSRLALAIDGTPVPDTDFIAGSTTNDRERFATEAVCFGSPAPAASATWPPMSRCVQVFESAVDRLAAAVRNVDDAKLDTKVKWGAVEFPLWQLCLRMLFHNGTHVGQIADLRRAFNMTSIFA